MKKTRETLLKEITDFLVEAQMTETAFGLRALNDGHLVRNLRSGRAVSIDTADRIRGFIREAHLH